MERDDNPLAGEICKHKMSKVLDNGITIGEGSGIYFQIPIRKFLSKSKDERGCHVGSAPLPQQGELELRGPESGSEV